MPPKRKQTVVDLVSESELEDESDDELDLNNSLKFIQRIEALAKKRNDKRNAITAGFDKFIADTKGAIEKHYAAEAKKRSAEIKDLLTRRAQALQKRAAIECEIKALISQGRKDTHDIMVILEEVQFYKYRKSSTTAGSLASLISSRAIPAHSTGPIVTPP
ncbi:hypothetical protein NPX13_g982 [Xylaria arbuscula]|uniref:Uncharacterized protein n=1 Tax=Xylaria arbuscula TaxID=114810 RepID=A0A9W8NMA4_9PEZI|nr:hypothetical protein NPX13_g982 [Xylaria arbuscula]